ncbi:unnamed protein product [Ectocarpus sp. 4 AP-2014]
MRGSLFRLLRSLNGLCFVSPLKVSLRRSKVLAPVGRAGRRRAVSRGEDKKYTTGGSQRELVKACTHKSILTCDTFLPSSFDVRALALEDGTERRARLRPLPQHQRASTVRARFVKRQKKRLLRVFKHRRFCDTGGAAGIRETIRNSAASVERARHHFVRRPSLICAE